MAKGPGSLDKCWNEKCSAKPAKNATKCKACGEKKPLPQFPQKVVSAVDALIEDVHGIGGDEGNWSSLKYFMSETWEEKYPVQRGIFTAEKAAQDDDMFRKVLEARGVSEAQIKKLMAK